MCVHIVDGSTSTDETYTHTKGPSANDNVAMSLKQRREGSVANVVTVHWLRQRRNVFKATSWRFSGYDNFIMSLR